MRGNRIKNVTSELAGERIDIVRWSDDPMVLIPNALQPAQVEQVLLCDMIGRAIALVNDEHLSQAIGRFGQNVRLASKLCGWDIEIMTAPELERQIERAMEAFMQIDGMTEEVAQQLVEQGYLSFDDLSVIEPEALIEMGGYSEDQVNSIVEQAEDRAAEQEAEEEARKRQDKLDKERRASEELDRLEKLEAAGKVPVAAEQPEASVEDSPAPESGAGAEASGAESEVPVAGAEEPATGAESLESPSEPRVEG
jgi:N utilization substance protein A